MRGRKSMFKLNSQSLLSYVASNQKVTRKQAKDNHPFNTPGQIAYWLDKFRKQGKVRRHRGKGGAFVYTFKHF